MAAADGAMVRVKKPTRDRLNKLLSDAALWARHSLPAPGNADEEITFLMKIAERETKA